MSSRGADVRAVVLTAPGRMEQRTFKRPLCHAEDGLLLVEANGVCGTDVHFRASEENVPRILGHEVVGRVLEVGDEAARRWGVEPGDRVAVESSIACGTCRDCRGGFSQTCSARLGYGSNVTTDVQPALWGGFAEQMYLAPGTILTKIPSAVSADVAAGWFSPLANAADWTGPLGVDVQPGAAVVVLGPGAQGLSACLAARARGASLVVLAGLKRDEPRLRAATALGVDRTVMVDEESLQDVVAALTAGELADAVLDVSGSERSATLAPHLVRRRGTVVAASPLTPRADVALPVKEMIWRQIRWQGVLSNRPTATAAAAALLGRFGDALAPLVTHRFELDDADRAIDVVAGKDVDAPAIKVVVCPNGVQLSAGRTLLSGWPPPSRRPGR
jgi:threonine dehydrogenase-like Zn-dependent dehydrogenase